MQKFALSIVLLCSGVAAAQELVSGKDPRHKRSLNYQHTEISESKSELASERYKKRRSKESVERELASGKESVERELASGKESVERELASDKESVAKPPEVFYADDISIDRDAGVRAVKDNTRFYRHRYSTFLSCMLY